MFSWASYAEQKFERPVLHVSVIYASTDAGVNAVQVCIIDIEDKGYVAGYILIV